MKKLKDFKKSNKDNKTNAKKRDVASWAIMIFAALFIAMMGRVFMYGGTTPVMPGAQNVNISRPVELSFSDVLRRADEIKTMTINGNDATGTLADGTKYNATITYDPEMLAKLADAGTAITIDTSRG